MRNLWNQSCSDGSTPTNNWLTCGDFFDPFIEIKYIKVSIEIVVGLCPKWTVNNTLNRVSDQGVCLKMNAVQQAFLVLQVVIFMCILLDYFDKKVDEGGCDLCVSFLNGLAKNIGKVLVIVVYLLTTFISFTAFFIIIPYEQVYKPEIFLIFLTLFGFYLMINIVYHYHKARSIPPVENPGSEGDKWCYRCSNFKSERTHHCSICGKCILGMDHHCIWINQCVGSHNHRHFFLFISFLSLALLTITSCGINCAWDHIFIETAENTYCTSLLWGAPLQGWICEHKDLPRNCIIFCYCISILLLLLVGGLTLWNVYLVSKGITYIDYLNISDRRHSNPQYKNPLNKGFKNNWTNFLGLRRNRTFFLHVLLPSSHPPILYFNYNQPPRQEIV